MVAIAAERRRAASGAALIVFGGGLALYQLTTLALGPAAEVRELPLAIAAPSVELPDLSQPVIDNVKLVLGTMASPAAPAPGLAAREQKVVVKTAVLPKPAATPKTPTQALVDPPTNYHDGDERSLRLARRR